MKKAYLILLALLVVALAALLPGCSSNVDELEGKYVVTFELNGGILDLKSTNVSTNINYAYEPGSFIVDPTCAEWNYKLTRAGYTFTGWYTSENCAAGEKWDFATGKITTEKLTLYAGWEKEIVYRYNIFASIIGVIDGKIDEFNRDIAWDIKFDRTREVELHKENINKLIAKRNVLPAIIICTLQFHSSEIF